MVKYKEHWTKRKEIILNSLLAISILLVFIAIVICLVNKVPTKEQSDEFIKYNKLISEHCCNGQYCTDTIYNEKDGKCYSTLYGLGDASKQIIILLWAVVIATITSGYKGGTYCLRCK